MGSRRVRAWRGSSQVVAGECGARAGQRGVFRVGVAPAPSRVRTRHCAIPPCCTWPGPHAHEALLDDTHTHTHTHTHTETHTHTNTNK